MPAVQATLDTPIKSFAKGLVASLRIAPVPAEVGNERALKRDLLGPLA